jgi:hypothetical protein
MRLHRWTMILSIFTALLGMGLWVTHLPKALPAGLP